VTRYIMCLVTDDGPTVTAITHAGGAVHLRCSVQFNGVVRTNAHVTWYDAKGKMMPLLSATALSATTLSPGCKAAKRRRRRRWRRGTGGKYTCKVAWGRSRPYIPDRVRRHFLVLSTSHTRPPLELCLATDPCAKSKSHHPRYV